MLTLDELAAAACDRVQEPSALRCEGRIMGPSRTMTPPTANSRRASNPASEDAIFTVAPRSSLRNDSDETTTLPPSSPPVAAMLPTLPTFGPSIEPVPGAGKLQASRDIDSEIVGKAILAEAVYDVERSDKKIFPEEISEIVQVVLRNRGLLQTVDRLISELFFDSMPRECVTIERIEQVWPALALCRFLQRLDGKDLGVRAVFHGTRKEKVSQGDLGTLNADRESSCDEPTDGSVGGSPERCTGAVEMHAGSTHRHAVPDNSGIRRMMVVLVGDLARERPATTGGSNEPAQRCSMEGTTLLLSHVIHYRVHEVDPFEKKLGSAVRRSRMKA